MNDGLCIGGPLDGQHVTDPGEHLAAAPPPSLLFESDPNETYKPTYYVKQWRARPGTIDWYVWVLETEVTPE